MKTDYKALREVLSGLVDMRYTDSTYHDIMDLTKEAETLNGGRVPEVTEAVARIREVAAMGHGVHAMKTAIVKHVKEDALDRVTDILIDSCWQEAV